MRQAGFAQPLQLRFELRQAVFARSLFCQLLVDLVQQRIDRSDLLFDRAAFLGCSLPVGLPDFQPQDAAQDALAVPWALLGELVRFTLQEE